MSFEIAHDDHDEDDHTSCRVILSDISRTLREICSRSFGCKQTDANPRVRNRNRYKFNKNGKIKKFNWKLSTTVNKWVSKHNYRKGQCLIGWFQARNTSRMFTSKLAEPNGMENRMSALCCWQWHLWLYYLLLDCWRIPWRDSLSSLVLVRFHEQTWALLLRDINKRIMSGCYQDDDDDAVDVLARDTSKQSWCYTYGSDYTPLTVIMQTEPTARETHYSWALSWIKAFTTAAPSQDIDS